jgi:NAD+ kinase
MANATKSRAVDVLRRIVAKATELGLNLCSDPATAGLLNSIPEIESDRLFDQADAVMALGGDGTMLRVVRALDGRDKPVIGVNIGGLGFLTSVTEQSLEQALQCLASDNFTTSLRSIEDCVLERGGTAIARYRALNDVVVARGPSARVVTLDVSIDGDRVTSYVCDGLVVSTPTGSTGHSLSAGGPILVPETRAFVMALICPHTLSSRPLVVPDSGEILVRVADTEERILLTVDGQIGQPLEHGDCVRIRRSDRTVRFIHLPGYSYFAVLRQKLGWKGSSV